VLLVAGASTLRGDGGLVRLSEKVEHWRVTVFTAPTPLQVGPIEISVLVQDERGQPVEDLDVTVTISNVSSTGLGRTIPATQAAATNKIFYDAVGDVSSAGPWRFVVDVAGMSEPSRFTFEADVAPARPRWVDLWFWIAWPVIPVMLFVAHQVLSRRGHPS
jgi:hypothetical protein